VCVHMCVVMCVCSLQAPMNHFCLCVRLYSLSLSLSLATLSPSPHPFPCSLLLCIFLSQNTQQNSLVAAVARTPIMYVVLMYYLKNTHTKTHLITFAGVRAHIHTHTHAHAHTHIHAYTHAHVHTRTCTCQTFVQRDTHACTHAFTFETHSNAHIAFTKPRQH